MGSVEFERLMHAPLRDRLNEMVGDVSRRLARVLEWSPALDDEAKAFVSRIANDIAALQSKLLQYLHSAKWVSPAKLQELIELEHGALRTLEQLEDLIHRTTRAAATRAVVPASYQTPLDFGTDAHVLARGAHQVSYPQYNYVDVEAEVVTTTPHYQPHQMQPAPLVPVVMPSYEDAIRRELSGFNGGGYAEPVWEPAPEPVHYARPAPIARSRAVVPVAPPPAKPEPAPNVVDRLFGAIGRHYEAIKSRSPRAALAGFALILIGIGAMLGRQGADGIGHPLAAPATLAPSDAARLAARDQPLNPDTAARPAKLVVSPDDGAQQENLAMPSDATALYVPVFATVTTRNQVEERLKDLEQRHPEVSEGGVRTGIEPVLGADGRQWYRAFLLPARSQADVKAFCASVRETGFPQCWAKRLSR